MRRQWRPMARQTCFRSALRYSLPNRRGCRVRVTEGNGRNEGPVPFISSGGYRACAFWRKALIGQNLIAVSRHCSHYMENSMPYLACLPVGDASLANDDVMRGGGGCRDRNVA